MCARFYSDTDDSQYRYSRSRSPPGVSAKSGPSKPQSASSSWARHRTQIPPSKTPMPRKYAVLQQGKLIEVPEDWVEVPPSERVQATEQLLGALDAEHEDTQADMKHEKKRAKRKQKEKRERGRDRRRRRRETEDSERRSKRSRKRKSESSERPRSRRKTKKRRNPNKRQTRRA